MIPVTAVYSGLLLLLFGVLAALRPLPKLGLGTRRHGLLLAAAGALLCGAGVALPAREKRVAAPHARIDEFAPHYHFNEFHSIRVAAPPHEVYRAIKDVTAREIRFFQTLVWIRRFGQRGPESILNPGDQPLLDVALRTGFLELAREPEREFVMGMVVVSPSDTQLPDAPAAFRTLGGPGIAKAVMNFRIRPDGKDSSVITTETRVFATDASARRRFAAYWRIILPGSALIRRNWLQAIRRRAEDVYIPHDDLVYRNGAANGATDV